eukprot:scaffold954_cov173-Ochromonas_danica.AAC.19
MVKLSIIGVSEETLTGFLLDETVEWSTALNEGSIISYDYHFCPNFDNKSHLWVKHLKCDEFQCFNLKTKCNKFNALINYSMIISVPVIKDRHSATTMVQRIDTADTTVAAVTSSTIVTSSIYCFATLFCR